MIEETQTERIKRLMKEHFPESPAGSGAPSCCVDAERGPTSGAEEEERSDEPKTAAVAPGEAEANYVCLMEGLEYEAAKLDHKADRLKGGPKLYTAAQMLKAKAAVYRSCKVRVWTWWPEPDNEAPKERSGRRNV